MELQRTVARTLDDAMGSVFRSILESGTPVTSTKGANRELSGVSFEIENPRSRLSRSESRGKPFSCLGELCWYLSRSKDARFISYYLSHYKGCPDIRGAYGPRLFDWRGIDQVRNVTDLLRRKPGSRQAIIQIVDRNDIPDGVEDIPCTCVLQFFIRESTLNMVTYMRSNDAFLGLPHDFFCFTMLQEIIARDLQVELGTYTHMVGSLHLYDKDQQKAKQFLEEGFQSTMPIMPPMPRGNPWESIQWLLELENDIRNGQAIEAKRFAMPDSYWADIGRLLLAFRYKKEHDERGLEGLRSEFYCKEYCHFLHLN